MLDGRYSLATNNIAPQDVASVEVMENHQPIKALRDMIYSDRAALNLRLKKQARAHWTGTLRAAAGASTDEALWNGSAFAMRIASGSQSSRRAASRCTTSRARTRAATRRPICGS